jgi:hypothetical protein
MCCRYFYALLRAICEEGAPVPAEIADTVELPSISFDAPSRRP